MTKELNFDDDEPRYCRICGKPLTEESESDDGSGICFDCDDCDEHEDV